MKPKRAIYILSQTKPLKPQTENLILLSLPPFLCLSSSSETSMESINYVPHGGLAAALNANIYGNGTQTLVLSYGYGLDQNVWQLLLPYLVCCFKDLVNLLDELQLKNTVYLGHSMSAMIGSIAATQRPDLFQHLILLSGSPRGILMIVVTLGGLRGHSSTPSSTRWRRTTRTGFTTLRQQQLP
ncbi:unnamed protein product [Linum tenue]|uniref:AB hydrolase-1 domain-containing protein n=1 Tax=Linum tenue TaxID=586396 RepID=A0AAV0IY90_9ROSI|nr:unnamed protein product [Linum tenue]